MYKLKMSAEYSDPGPGITELQPLWDQVDAADTEVGESHASIANSKILLAYLDGKAVEHGIAIVHRARRYASLLMGCDFVKEQGEAYEVFLTGKGRNTTRQDNVRQAERLLRSYYQEQAELLADTVTELCLDETTQQRQLASSAVAITMMQLHDLREKRKFDGIVAGPSVASLQNIDLSRLARKEEGRRKAALAQRSNTIHLKPSDWRLLKARSGMPLEQAVTTEDTRDALRLLAAAKVAVSGANIYLADENPSITNTVISFLGHIPQGDITHVGYRAYRLACFLHGITDEQELKELEAFHKNNPISQHKTYSDTVQKTVRSNQILSQKLNICLPLVLARTPDQFSVAQAIAGIFSARIDELATHKAKETELAKWTATGIEALVNWLGSSDRPADPPSHAS